MSKAEDKAFFAQRPMTKNELRKSMIRGLRMLGYSYKHASALVNRRLKNEKA